MNRRPAATALYADLLELRAQSYECVSRAWPKYQTLLYSILTVPIKVRRVPLVFNTLITEKLIERNKELIKWMYANWEL